MHILLSISNIDCQNPNGYTSLMLAACNGHVGGVRLLLDYGANVNLQHRGEWTALMLAVSRIHIDSVNVLLPFCDINMTTLRGTTATVLTR